MKQLNISILISPLFTSDNVVYFVVSNCKKKKESTLPVVCFSGPHPQRSCRATRHGDFGLLLRSSTSSAGCAASRCWMTSTASPTSGQQKAAISGCLLSSFKISNTFLCSQVLIIGHVSSNDRPDWYLPDKQLPWSQLGLLGWNLWIQHYDYCVIPFRNHTCIQAVIVDTTVSPVDLNP